MCLCHFLVFNSASNSFFVIYFPASGWDVAYLHYAQAFGDMSEKGGDRWSMEESAVMGVGVGGGL